MKRYPWAFDEDAVLDEVRSLYRGADPAHDFSHILRVYHNARQLGEVEGADMQVLLLAALLHDVGSVSKTAREESGSRTRKVAGEFLERMGFHGEVRRQVLYAVEVHGFSRGIVPETLEAKVLQDADRLDAMGAIGIARVFTVGGALGREIYNPEDPFCRHRVPDDGRWNLDHFFKKLLVLESGMHTGTARAVAGKRAAVLRRYIQDLEEEICGRAFAPAVGPAPAPGDGAFEDGLMEDD